MINSDDLTEVPALEKLAADCRQNGEYDEAEQHYKRALEILATKSTFVTERVAQMQIHHNLGLMHRTLLHFDQAEPEYKQALELAKKIFGEKHPSTIERQNYLAALYCAWERYEESERLLLDSLSFYEGSLGKTHEVTAITLFALALVTRRSSMTDPNVAPVIGGRCKTYYDRAGTVLGIKLPELNVDHSRDLFRALMRVSYDRFGEGRFDEAEELFRHSLLSELNEIWPHHPLVSDAYQILGDLYRSFGTPQQAEKLYRKALALRAEAYGDQHEKTAASAQALGQLLLQMEQAEEATPFLKQACEAYRQTSDFPPRLATSLQTYAQALHRSGHKEEADRANEEAARILKEYDAHLGK